MLTQRLSEKFNTNEPIFTREILDCFCEFSRPYVFRMIKTAEKKREIICFDTGVYFLPTKSVIGISTITADDVVKKRFIGNGRDVYGVYSGLSLQNMFSLTTQMPNATEIITNNETTRRREIEIDGRKFILRRSRCNINKDNMYAYTVMELLSEIKLDANSQEEMKRSICNYMRIKNVQLKDLFILSSAFPAKTTKNLIACGVINEFTQG